MQNRLNRVVTNSLEAIKIELNSNSNTFGLSGSMTAILPDGEDPSLVTFHWEQLEGVAVTYTSALDGQTITFTTSELVRKKFKVCTNFGTDVEQCAIAEFLHFPNELLENKGNRIAFLDIKKTNSFSTEAVLPAYKQNGLIAIDPSNINYATDNYGDLSTTTDSYTTINTTGTLSDDIVDSVTVTELWRNIVGVWNIVESTASYKSVFDNILITDDAYKIVYKYNLRGLSSSITLPVNSIPYKGASDRILQNNKRVGFVGFSNYQSLLQTSTKLSLGDTIDNRPNRVGVVLFNNYQSVLQTSTKVDLNDSISFDADRVAYLAINNYVQSLQTSTGAT